MPELQDVTGMLEAARGAAIGGDLASADELLRGAARIQESQLGPLHPDLANTLNNLAIVSEKLERPGDAEAFYRRASAIASAALPADHPMVVESRQNLEAFCRARGLPITPAAVTPTPPAKLPAPVPRGTVWRTTAWVAISVAIVLSAALFVGRQSSRQAATPEPTATPPTRLADQPAASPPATAALKEIPSPPKAPASSTVSLAAAQLCQRFSTSDDIWRCDQAGSSVAPGRLVLYTRVRSARDAVVVHRWYRGDTVRQSVKSDCPSQPDRGIPNV